MEGGTAKVAERKGLVRTDSFGGLPLSRSVDFVSIRRRFGTLGRRCGRGLLNPIDDGVGEGVASTILIWFESADDRVRDDDTDGIVGKADRGRGDGGLEAVEDDGSISGNCFDRKAVCVSNWNKPAPFFGPFWGAPLGPGFSATLDTASPSVTINLSR